jgi:hypothetical protein
VQFRLQSAEDCSHTVGILERRGMEFQQQRPRTGRPSSARPETNGAEARPSTSKSYSAKGTFDVPAAPPKPNPFHPNPFHLQTLEAGGLSSQTPVGVRRIPNIDQTASRQPPITRTTDNIRQQGHFRTPTIDADHSMLVPDRAGLDSSATRVAQNDMGRDPDNAARYQMTSSPARTAPPSNAYNRPTLHVDAGSRAMSPRAERLPVSENAHLSGSELSSIYHSTAAAGASTGDDYIFAKRSTGLYQPSAPASLRLPDTLEHEMPPRRELPFKRPGSHQSSSSRPSTSAKSSSHSTAGADSSEPTVASSMLSPARNVSTHRPATASPLKRAIAPSHLEPTKKALAIEKRPQTQASLLPSASSPPRHSYLSSNDGSFRRPNDLGKLLRIAKPLAARSPNSSKVVRTDSTADAQYELETPPGSSSTPSKINAHTVASSSPSRTGGRIATSLSKPDRFTVSDPSTKSTVPAARPSSVAGGPADGADSVALADYASQSREDRQTVLDEFMVSKLEDPNFAVLCEDLDSCWRRIALGL